MIGLQTLDAVGDSRWFSFLDLTSILDHFKSQIVSLTNDIDNITSIKGIYLFTGLYDNALITSITPSKTIVPWTGTPPTEN